MKDFTNSIHCASRAHCRVCRSDPAWRKAVGAPDECPHGVTGLGDRIERLVKPIAKALRLPCLAKDGTLKPESLCAQRRNRINSIL